MRRGGCLSVSRPASSPLCFVHRCTLDVVGLEPLLEEALPVEVLVADGVLSRLRLLKSKCGFDAAAAAAGVLRLEAAAEVEERAGIVWSECASSCAESVWSAVWSREGGRGVRGASRMRPGSENIRDHTYISLT